MSAPLDFAPHAFVCLRRPAPRSSELSCLLDGRLRLISAEWEFFLLKIYIPSSCFNVPDRCHPSVSQTCALSTSHLWGAPSPCVMMSPRYRDPPLSPARVCPSRSFMLELVVIIDVSWSMRPSCVVHRSRCAVRHLQPVTVAPLGHWHHNHESATRALPRPQRKKAWRKCVALQKFSHDTSRRHESERRMYKRAARH
ncbi:hypothetical protein BC834DRAFT_572637 [Gloeopeniophorella convolvens]|nr:hypothetical protein BC834DRAFT_572637 [Gloeopeniophorella convolvens]